MECKMLFTEEPIVINKLSAKILGVDEAIIIQQIHYWLNINEKAKINKHENRYWTYNTYEKWQEKDFPFYSISTLKRKFKKLEKEGIIIKGNFNKKKYDKTLWVTLNYEKLNELLLNHEKIDNSSNDTTETMSNCNGLEAIENNNNNNNVEISTECQVDTMHSVKLTLPIPKTTLDYLSMYVCIYEKHLVISRKVKTFLADNEIYKRIDLDLFEDVLVEVMNNNRVRAKDNYFLKKIQNLCNKGIKTIEQYKADTEAYKQKNINSKRNKETKHAPKSTIKFSNVKRTENWNIKESFRDYTPDELEEILRESQKGKF